MGREYPLGYGYFRERARIVFRKNKNETSVAKIRELIDRGWYVVGEVEALYKLKKYRALKRMYYD